VPASSPSRTPRPLARLLFVVALWLPGAVLAQAQPPATPQDHPAAMSYSALADTLEDPQARQRLIEDLRQLAAKEKGGAAEAPAEKPSLPERIAAGSQDLVEQVVHEFDDAVRALSALRAGPAIGWDAVGRVTLRMASLVLVTGVVFLLLRRLVRLLFARAEAWALRSTGHMGLLRRTAAALFAVLVDGVTIALAWIAGWVFAEFVLGESGAVAARLALFLNAFVAIEVFKVLLRAVFSSRYDGLRLIPIRSEDAAYWYAWLAHLASFVGYGTLLVVPIVGKELSPALGRLVYVLVLAFGFVYALSIILQNRAGVRARLEALAQRADLGFTRVAAAMLARVWHLAAIAYLVALTSVLLTRPKEALPYMATATAQSLLAIGVGVLVGAVIGRAIRQGIRIPEETRARFPHLEARLNAFVPRGLQAIRLVLMALVVALVLDAWQVFDLGAWLGSDAGLRVVSVVSSVLVVLVLAAAIWIVAASWIDYWLSPATGTGEPTARHRTLLALFRNALAVLIVTMTAMITLSQLGINIGPLIAGAGVIGLAIGFGAQKLVQDIIGGVFIQLENAINTGDWVTAGGVSGTAERLSIRSVGLRDIEGTFHIVPFSSVDTVSNYMRDFAYHVGEYGVAYREDTDEVVTHLIAAFKELMEDPEIAPQITGDLEIAGVTALADSSVNIRVRIRTSPGYQWKTGRAYNRLVKRHFDAAGIEIPFPHTTLYFGEDKLGKAPAANVRLLGDEPGTSGETAAPEHASARGRTDPETEPEGRDQNDDDDPA